MMEESHIRRRIELKPKLQRISFGIGIFCLLAVAASLFSLPFPFVRPLWIREVVGLSGLTHVMIFLIILREIEKKHSVPALLAGIGLILNEQILSCRGFWALAAYRALDFDSIFYFSISMIVESLLVITLCSVLRDFYLIRKIIDQQKPPAFKDPLDSLRLLIPSVLSYAAVSAAIFYGVQYLQGEWQYTLFKNLTWIATVTSMIGIGMEVNDCVDGIQSQNMCRVKSFSHLVCLTALLWVIYRLISIESVLL